MPVLDCIENGNKGYKYGDSGKCYTYKENNEGDRRNAKKSAVLQGLTYDEFKVGVPHYTKDGKLYEGPTHKHNGRLMTGAVHTEDSEFLYHKEDFAKIGERGAITKSKKAPKSDTPNPSPQGKGTSKGSASSTRGAEVSKSVEETLQKKAEDWNKRYKEKRGYGANVGALKSVYQRGLGAYNTSRSPFVKSASQWSYARVNAFLYLLKNGRPQNPKYTTDNDLLPKGHPKNTDK